MDIPQTWMDRNALELGTEDADALNDETFGDGADWDDPDPVRLCEHTGFQECKI